MQTDLGPRFWRFVDKESSATGCWLWRGSAPGGYGQFTWNGRKVAVHRLAYTKLVGLIPPGFDVDHLCGNTLCVRAPEHLEAVPPLENQRRKRLRNSFREVQQRADARAKERADQLEVEARADQPTSTSASPADSIERPAPLVVVRDVTPDLAKLVERIPYCPWTPHEVQQRFLLDMSPEAFFGGAAGPGKMQHLDSLLATPGGFTAIRDIHPGDVVFGRNGKPTTVLAESETITAPAWRLTFDDGAQVEVHDDHQWLTFSGKELTALTRKTDDWRAARRAKRPSRVTGRKSATFTASLTKRNQTTNSPPCDHPPTGTVRTTREIVDSLCVRGTRRNHAVPVAGPLDLPDRVLPLDPYLLGAWLGDGTSREGAITTMDGEIVSAFEAGGFALRRSETKPKNRASTYFFDGLRDALKLAEVLNNKHVPHEYLWAGPSQRLALLQGLLDTDGCVTDNRYCSFTNTNRCLTEAVAHLARSLGCKVRVVESRAKLYGRDCGPVWDVTFSASFFAFRLPRKATKQQTDHSRRTKFRYITSAERIDPIPMKCIRVAAEDHLYLLGEHLIPTHNSVALLMAALQFIQVPGYSALILRRTYADLAKPRALMDLAREWFAPYAKSGVARWRDKIATWEFPNNAKLAFGYLSTPADRFQYQSAAYQFVAFDELTHFPFEDYYTYLFSRCRKPSGVSVDPLLARVPIRVRSASNPGGVGHAWVRRRFILEGAAHGRAYYPASLEDNPHIDQAEYDRALSFLPPHERAQLRYGDWYAPPPGSMFQRQWFVPDQLVDEPPDGRWDWVRFWKVQPVPKPNAEADYCSGALVGRRTDGMICIRAIATSRSTPHDNEELMKLVSASDGSEVSTYVQQENGKAGEDYIKHVRQLMNAERRERVRVAKSSGDLGLRAEAVSSLAQAKFILVCEGAWFNKFMEEAELFPDGPTQCQVHAVSGAVARLQRRAGVNITGLHTVEQVNPWAMA